MKVPPPDYRLLITDYFGRAGAGVSTTTLKPIRPARMWGAKRLREAERQSLARLSQLPPRRTRRLPLLGPVGSLAAVRPGDSPYRSLHHSQTLPRMSYRPQAFSHKPERKTKYRSAFYAEMVRQYSNQLDRTIRQGRIDAAICELKLPPDSPGILRSKADRIAEILDEMTPAFYKDRRLRWVDERDWKARRDAGDVLRGPACRWERIPDRTDPKMC